MKKILTLAFAVCTMTTAAMAQKIGHFSVNQVMAEMPEFKTAESELEVYAKEYQGQLANLEKEFTDKQTKYMNDKSKLTGTQIEIMENELQTIYQRLQEFSQTASQAVEKKRNDLLKPIFDKVNTAIKSVATKGNYDYILESEVFLYGKESNDISGQIKAELGIK